MKKRISLLLAGLLMLAGCGTDTSAAVQAVESAVPEVSALPKEAAEGLEQVSSAIDDTLAKEELGQALSLKILAPNGAPALVLLPVAAMGGDVTFVDGADALQAAFVNPTPEYDVIVAPSNLGMKLAAADKTGYRMLGIVTWGNLYTVGKADLSADPSTWTKVAAFGEQSVTGIIFKKLYGDKIPENAITWYNSTAEAAAALLSGEADVAMLAEPNATASIGKAKQNGLDLKVLTDLQKDYGEGGFPQAALFVRKDKYDENSEVFNHLLSSISEIAKYHTALSEEYLVAEINEAGGAEKFGIPSAEIAAKTWAKLNINPSFAKDHIDELKAYGTLFGIDDITNAVIQ